MGSKAEDTLRVFWLKKNTSGYKSCAESELDGSDSEHSAVSGPSSPSAARQLMRCRTCESLFSKMRRQQPPKTKQRNNDPASLSCDEWLFCTRFPAQRSQQSRGMLWTHLKRIRLRAAKQEADGVENKAWSFCSRPHVFLKRNLRHCKKMLGKPSKRKAKSHQRSHVKPVWPLPSRKSRSQMKRKSSEQNDTSEHLSPIDLTCTSEDEAAVNNGTHHESMRRLEKVPRKQSVGDVSGFMDMQTNYSGLEGTRRALKFNTSPNSEHAQTQTPKHCPLHAESIRNFHESQAGTTSTIRECSRSQDEVLLDGDTFRTPTDPFSADLKIIRKIKPSRPFSTRKGAFRTMLSVLGRGHNQIFKESHH